MCIDIDIQRVRRGGGGIFDQSVEEFQLSLSISWADALSQEVKEGEPGVKVVDEGMEVFAAELLEDDVVVVAVVVAKFSDSSS